MASKHNVAANDEVGSTENNIKPKNGSYDINSRLSKELVIAFVAPVGSGASTTYEAISKIIQKDYGYDSVYIKLSEIIKEHASKVSENIGDGSDGKVLVDQYQTVGNKLRTDFNEAYLVDRAIEKIAIERLNRGGYETVEDGIRIVKPVKRVYFLDSLKNPAEIKRLRQVYGDILWVITVFANEDVRLNRLISGGMNEDVARHAMKRDYEEEERSGQKVSKIAHQANYFIRNNTDLKDDLKVPIKRFLEVIMGVKLHTPNEFERGMLEASSAAIRSACLSRQVGAAVYDKQGQLLGIGCNDVPKFEGGLYSEGDIDHRCFHWKDKECHNDKHKLKLAKKIAEALATGTDEQIDKVSKILELGLGNLIEFSRSVHAEMEAIVSVARLGSGSLLGGTLYTTTFPCHNCARHVVAAGINKVVYVEPYSKSLALELHSDSISTDESCTDKVRFLQYQGFAPRTSIRLFSSVEKERKNNGKFIEISIENSTPVFASPLDSYTTSENLIIQELEQEGQKGDKKN